jgi:hypothetical protein
LPANPLAALFRAHDAAGAAEIVADAVRGACRAEPERAVA